METSDQPNADRSVVRLDPVARRLNLGCGQMKLPDCLNVDFNPAVEPDVVWDLDRRPYPFPKGHFERVFVKDVIEHLEDVPGFMTEIHSLLAPGSVVEITTPHFSSANAFTDPTHRRQLGWSSFDYFTESSQWSFYTGVRFEILHRTIVFHHSTLNRVVSRLANRYPAAYEHRWAWIFPAWFLIFELRAIPSDRE